MRTLHEVVQGLVSIYSVLCGKSNPIFFSTLCLNQALGNVNGNLLQDCHLITNINSFSCQPLHLSDYRVMILRDIPTFSTLHRLH